MSKSSLGINGKVPTQFTQPISLTSDINSYSNEFKIKIWLALYETEKIEWEPT